MNIFIDFIDYYDQILTVFFFSRMGSVIFQEMAGVRGGCPILFFFNLIRTSSKETHLKQDEPKVRKIMRIFSSSICALYISAASPAFVVLQPNLQEMLTIAQKTCSLQFVLFSPSLLLLGCFQLGIMEIFYANLFTFQRVFEGKIGFREIK